MKFTVLGPNGITSASTTYTWHIHGGDCKDLGKTKYRMCDIHVFEAENIDEALAYWIDEELQEMGYSNEDVRVFPCCRQEQTAGLKWQKIANGHYKHGQYEIKQEEQSQGWVWQIYRDGEAVPDQWWWRLKYAKREVEKIELGTPA